MPDTEIFYKGQWRQFKGRRHWECVTGQTYGVQDPPKDNQVRVKFLTAFTHKYTICKQKPLYYAPSYAYHFSPPNS